MHTFFIKDLSSQVIFLTNEESKHAIKVLRIKAGMHVRLIDGNGTEALGNVLNDSHKACEISIEKRTNHPVPEPYHLHVGIAPTKNMDRFEWFLEKATELGIHKITPLITENSERNRIKVERCEKILVSAVKQSQRMYLPQLEPLTSFPQFIEQNKAKLKLVAHCEEENKKPLFRFTADETRDTAVLIGPEGDFSPTEIQAAKKQGFAPVSLGNSRLRTETAGIYTCNALNFIHQA